MKTLDKKTSSKNNIFRNDNNKTKRLIKCFFCGYHNKAIIKYYINGFESECAIQMVIFEDEPKIIKISDKKIQNDGQLEKEELCAKCGRISEIEDIPKEYWAKYKLIKRQSKLDKN